MWADRYSRARDSVLVFCVSMILFIVTYPVIASSAVNTGTNPAEQGSGDDAVGELASYMRRFRQEPVVNDLSQLTRRYGITLLPLLRVYARDADPQVASEAIRALIHQLRLASTPADRRIVVDFLAEMLRESYETGRRWNVGRTMLVAGQASDFTPAAKQILHDMVTGVLNGTYRHPGQIQEVILLVGVADARSEFPRLGELIVRWEEASKQRHQRELDQLEEDVSRYGQDVPRGLQSSLEALRKETYWQNTLFWGALRARARMGSKEDIQRCIKMVESHPDPDYRSDYLFDQLSYIRQPEVIEYLAPYLESDKKPPSGGHGTIVRSYAARAASAIATMLENAPIKSHQTSPEQIATLRQWLAEQTEWKFKR